MWIGELAEVAVKTGQDYEERDEGKFLICVFVGMPRGGKNNRLIVNFRGVGYKFCEGAVIEAD